MFFFANLYILATTFYRLTCTFFRLLLGEKHLKNVRALRAPCFGRYLMRKTPFWGLRSDDTKNKKLFLLFFPPPCLCWRAQRAEIFIFSLGFFVWNGLRTKIETFEIWKIYDFSNLYILATPILRDIAMIFLNETGFSRFQKFLPTNYWPQLIEG